MKKDGALLEVENLHTYFPVMGGAIRRKVANLKAVDGISFRINRGEILGLVGESGCGKTTTGRCIMKLCKITRGKVFYEGKDLSKLSSGKMRNMQQNIQMIFENPSSSLDPMMSVEEILAEPLQLHNLVKGDEYKEQVAELLRMVQLEPYMAVRHPQEFSTGQRQRLEIARALALRPSFVICDNPVAHLDVVIQTQVIAMLTRLQEELNLSYLFIAHDLAVVRNISDRVLVMYVGKIMETANVDQFFDNPLHPYTQALMSAVLTPDPVAERQRKLIILPGETPSSINPPSGCRFHPRCNRAIDSCRELEPELRNIGSEHWVACHRV